MTEPMAIVGRPLENRARLFAVARDTASAARSVLVVVPRVTTGYAWRSEFLRRAPALTGFMRATTAFGFAFALLRAERPDLTLLLAAYRRDVVATLLQTEHQGRGAASLWPTQHRFLGGPAFIDEVDHEVATRIHGSAPQPTAASGRASELAAFLTRYEAELSARSLADGPRAVRLAHDRLLIDDPIAEGLDPTGLLIIEQRDAIAPSAEPLVEALISRAERRSARIAVSARPERPAGDADVHGDDRCELLRVHHPAVQADAIVSVVRKWIDDGRLPERLAVVLPRRDPILLSELASAAARAGAPIVVPGAPVGRSPVVLECVRSIANRASADSSSDLARRAYAWWIENASSLLGDRRSIEMLATFIRALTNGDSLAAALDRPASPTCDQGVAVIALDDASDRPSDEPWQGVVLVGCVDGTLPRRRARSRWFTEEGAIPPHGQGRGASVEDALVVQDRRRIEDLLDAVASDGAVVAVAAPVGGVLTSPFVDGWRRRELSLIRGAANIPPRPSIETNGDVPLFPSGQLRLSATQLATFEDCSWRYAFEYGLGLRGAGGASATAGSLVHAVLERFLSSGSTDRSHERLRALLDDVWEHDEFPYAAQALDYRRRAEQWLGNWWEFYRDTSPDVRLTEHRFEVPFPAHVRAGAETDGAPPHTLVGSIDRIDVITPPSGGGGPFTRIVDYKSGAPKSQREVDDDLQLAIYHYAAIHDPGVQHLGRPDRLELHYLQDNTSKERVKVLSRAVTEDLEDQTVGRIGTLAAAILVEDYAPNPDANCDYCAFHTLCSTKQQGRHVR